MRPRELTIRGFRSYADEATFDFSGRSLIGIVGPIGSGKSSILDAVSFALYGKTPRIERDTKSLINQRRDSLHVALTFEVDGSQWKAVRSLRRGGASAHALYRVEDGEDREVADRARDVNETIESVLGLDFEAFRRSVLLAQNQFAEFLEATPVQRGSVLKGVFGFDRLDAMRDATKGRLDAVKGSLHVLTERRASADADRAALPAKQEALTAALARSAALEELRASVGAVDEAIRSAEARGAQAVADEEALDSVAPQIPAREETSELFATASTAEEDLAAAITRLQEATELAAAAAEKHGATLSAVGGAEAVDAAADLVARAQAAGAVVADERSRLEAAQEAVERGTAGVHAATEALAGARAAAEAAAAAAAEASTGEDGARQALHDAHAVDMAQSLRSSLVAGEPCPVCEQAVAVIPQKGAPAGIDAAESALSEAAAVATEARESASRAAAAVAGAEADLGAAAERLGDAETALASRQEAVAAAEESLADLTAQVVERIGEGDPAERLAEIRTTLNEAAAGLRAAQEAESLARRSVDEARAVRDDTRGRLDDLRSALSRLVGRLGADVDIGDSAGSLEEALVTVRTHWLERRGAAKEMREAAERDAASARLTRTELLEGAGLAAGDDIVQVTTEAARDATALGTEVALIEKRLAELDRLDEREAALLDQAALLERLHADLRPSAFLEFVLEERRRTLADLAGEHLEALTAGRYRFSDDGAFDLVDVTAAEGRRSPASLSGGETFLASLALALALAEIVGRQGGRLDAFFLDEGFGSLDPEHVELAMDGVERLVTGGADRLVVVVSHVEAMRDRIEDLIVLSRHPITDHTVVESGASR
jgi:DNA repair protein SbcC/Rad50